MKKNLKRKAKKIFIKKKYKKKFKSKFNKKIKKTKRKKIIKKNKIKKTIKKNKIKKTIKNKRKKIIRKNKRKKTIKKNKRKKIIKKIFKNTFSKSKKTKKISQLFDRNSKLLILKIIRVNEQIKKNLQFNFNLDQYLQDFFQGISNKIGNKINGIKVIIEEERQRKKQETIKKMHQEKIDSLKKIKLEKKLALEAKQKEFKDEIKFEKERKKDLQKFVRLEQAEVRKEQADKQRKFLEQIKLEKKIEQFRKREELEIKNLEKYVLSQERDSYIGVQERIDKIKQKYQALRDQKIRERVEQLGIKVEEGDDRSVLLEKEREYNLERQKIEFTLESFYRSAHSLCFQINKRYIPKYLSILRVIDRRFETGEIFIKWDDAADEDWLILIYIKDNSPDEGIVIEDKTNYEKQSSHEFKTNEIFKASDMMVDSLTTLLDRERNRKKSKK